MRVDNEKMIAKKEKMRKICKNCWHSIKNEHLSKSLAFRKAWLIDEIGRQGYLVKFNLFEMRTVYMLARINCSDVGSVKLLDEGLFQAKTRWKGVKLCKSRQSAVEFACSNQVNKYADQIPLF